MKINELIENLQRGIALREGRTCDVIKVGNGESVGKYINIQNRYGGSYE